MKVIVGLGNPGKKYENTRHNVGFDVITELARRAGQSSGKVKFEAELFETVIQGEMTLLVKPLTYMNASGRSVRQILQFYKLDLDSLLVISDDLNLETGRLRIRAKGSSGGQKGIQNTIDQLGGNQNFARLRIGIGRPTGRMQVVDYVLRKFTKSESEIIEPAIVLAADAAEMWVNSEIIEVMNQYNSAPENGKKKESGENQES